MDQSQGGNPFGRLIEFARPHKTGYIVSVVLAVLGVAFGIVPYFATARMTIELLSGNRDLSFYMVWCLISGGCFVLKAILMGISTRASHEATFEVLSEARRKIASKLTRVPMGYILNTPSGQLKNGMVERIEQLEVPLAHVIPEMTSNLLVPIAIIVYLFVLDWRMALVSLITIPVGMMCYMGMMKEYPKKYGEVVKAGNHMSATTVEYIGGIEVIKAFNQADNSYQKFTDAVHANADLILDWMKDTQKYSAIMMSVWPAALISVLPVGCLFYMSGSLSAATFITVTVLSLGIAGPLVAAMFFTDDIAKIGTVMGEIDGILNQPELVRPERKCDLQNLDIALENVHFAYEEKEVLKGIDLTIPQGKITAFVGPSGSGKSTIAKLIASFWDVTGGLISLGNLTSVSTATMSDLESMSFAIIVRTLVGVIHASIFSIAMCYFSWKISLIFLVGVILFMVINTMLLRCSKRLSPIRLEAQTEFMDAVLEYIQGMGVVRAFHMAKQSNTTLEKSIAETQKKNQLIERQRIPYIAAEQVVLRIASAAAAFCSIALFVNGTLELTYCLIILVSAFMVYSQLESAGEMFFMLSMIDASIDRVEEINQSPQIDIDGKEQTPDRLDIEMQDVSFSYGDKKVIDHVSLTIPQGTTTAIVGPSGSGKTTLVNLIARFWDVDSGSVRIGGIDVKDYKLDSLMKNISMVFQNVYLFPDTIENNIKFGSPNATHEDVVKAAKAARCHDFISALQEGYQTVIGESGATISGGEKQRISIARAIMKDAPIIILDEATANVDPENEAELQKAIEALTQGKTIIMIAHRLKTVKNADQIIVIDRGKISQQGTHDELIKQAGIYADFVGMREKAIGWKIKADSLA